MNERIALKVGENVKKVRLGKGFSLPFLAGKAHVPLRYLEDVENGFRSISLVRAYKIAGALSCDVSVLFLDLVENALPPSQP